MPKSKKAVAKAAPKAAPKAPKAIKEVLSKSALVANIAESSGVAAKDVRAVMAALENAVAGSVSKRGAGAFVLPGILKITSSRAVRASTRSPRKSSGLQRSRPASRSRFAR